MRHPERRPIAAFSRPFEVLHDLLFILLGGLLLALRNRVLPPVYFRGWIIIGAALILWGVRPWLWPGKRRRVRSGEWLRGILMSVAGSLCVAVALSPAGDFPVWITSIASILILRGLAGAAFTILHREASL
jgi:hypothetical protein